MPETFPYRVILASVSATAVALGCIVLTVASIFTPGDLVISTVSCSVGAAICNSLSGGRGWRELIDP